MDHAIEEGSVSAKVYERTMEKQQLTVCNALVKEVRPPDDPPDELESHLQRDATKTTLQDIIKKCGYAAGLN